MFEEQHRTQNVQIIIVYFFTAVALIGISFNVGESLLDSFQEITSGCTVLQMRSEQKADTKITGPLGFAVSASSTVQMTLVNEREVALGEFSDWDVIFEVPEAPGLGIAYLAYTTDAVPGSNQWKVKGIYLDASTLVGEIVATGVLNPGEEMVILVNPSPSVVTTSYDRATFVTPNGTSVKVIFKVVP